jgi:hypothetical protein
MGGQSGFADNPLRLSVQSPRTGCLAGQTRSKQEVVSCFGERAAMCSAGSGESKETQTTHYTGSTGKTG